MGRKLKGILLDELSAVDNPADPNARIVLFKRMNETGDEDMTDAQRAKMKEYMGKGYSEKEARSMCMGEKTTKGGHDMDPQELAAKLEALEGQVADLTKRAESAETTVETLTKSADEAGFEVSDGKITKRAIPEYIEIEGEKVEKSAVPAPLLKALEAQKAAIAKMEADKAEVDLAKRGATELPNLAGTDFAKGKLLKAVEGDEEVTKALKAADAAIAKQMEEIGNNPLDDEGSATHRLDKMVRDHSVDSKVDYWTAYAEVTKSGEGAELFRKSQSEG